MSDRGATIGARCAQRYRRLGAGESGAPPKTNTGEDGVSLVELLVVMAILALVATVALPARAPERGPSLAVLAADIAGKLRAARALAVAQSRDVAFAFDAEARTYVVEGAGAPQTLPQATDLSITTAREFVRDAKEARLTFFGDGTSSGGTIRLAHRQRSVNINVAWLTSAVEIAWDVP